MAETRRPHSPTGWSHRFWADRQDPDRVASELALGFIRQIDRALRRRGIVVMTGVEVECYPRGRLTQAKLTRFLKDVTARAPYRAAMALYKTPPGYETRNEWEKMLELGIAELAENETQSDFKTAKELLESARDNNETTTRPITYDHTSREEPVITTIIDRLNRHIRERAEHAPGADHHHYQHAIAALWAIEEMLKAMPPSPVYHVYAGNSLITEITTNPSPPSATVNHAVTLKKILSELGDHFENFLHATNTTYTQSPISRILKPQLLGKLGLQAEQDIRPASDILFGQTDMFNPNVTLGEHINISLHHIPPHAQPLIDWQRFDTGKYTLMDQPHIQSRLFDDQSFPGMFTHDALLFAPDNETSHSYFVNRNKGLARALIHKMDDRKNTGMPDRSCRRVEFRLPDAQSNIHLTMLAVMAGIYARVRAFEKEGVDLFNSKAGKGFEQVRGKYPELFGQPFKRAPQAPEQAIAAFEKGSMVINALKALAEEVGPDQLATADIARFKQSVIDRVQPEQAKTPAAAR